MTTRETPDLPAAPFSLIPGGPSLSNTPSVPGTAADNEPLAPGDEAPGGRAGTGKAPCRACGGSGNIDDEPCPECQGTGKVTVGIGGA